GGHRGRIARDDAQEVRPLPGDDDPHGRGRREGRSARADAVARRRGLRGRSRYQADPSHRAARASDAGRHGRSGRIHRVLDPATHHGPRKSVWTEIEEIVMKRLRERIAKRLSRAHRGMTLLEIMIVLAILALVMGLVVGPRVM